MEKTTADELATSIDATLLEWRLAFESSSPTKNDSIQMADDGDGDGDIDDSLVIKKATPIWQDRDAYHKRLCTFKAETYFAKPIAISPLVCAAFG